MGVFRTTVFETKILEGPLRNISGISRYGQLYYITHQLVVKSSLISHALCGIATNEVKTQRGQHVPSPRICHEFLGVKFYFILQ